jgi:hypothetical protein
MNHDVDEIFRRNGLARGRNFGSKSAYHANNPDSIFVPSAWVGTRRRGKLWGGDLDLTSADLSRLQEVAAALRLTLFVLREQVSDVRGKEVERRAHAIVTRNDCTLTPAALINLTARQVSGVTRITYTL